MTPKAIDFRALALPAAFDPEWDGLIRVEQRRTSDHRTATRAYDFSKFPDDRERLTQCRFWFANAFAQWSAGKEPSTIHARFSLLRAFFAFLATDATYVRSPVDIDQHVLDLLEKWLRGQPWAADQQRQIWNFVGKLMQMLAAADRALVRDDVRFHRFAGASRRHPNLKMTKDVLTRLELGRIIEACRQHVRSVRVMRAQASRDTAQARENGYQGTTKPNWASRGEVLSWLQKQYFSDDHTLKPVGQAIYSKLVRPQRHGFRSTTDIYRCFLMTAVDLIPYLVLIAGYTGINTSSLIELETTCLQRPPVRGKKAKIIEKFIEAHSSDRDPVYWSKGRATRTQWRTFEKGRDFLPPLLIREVLEMTKDQRPRVRPSDQHRLLIIDSNRRKVVWLSPTGLSTGLADFRRANNLPFFTIQSLRAALLNYGYVVTKGNIVSVQHLANHSSPDTTRHHYLAGPARQENDRLIGRAQMELIRWIKSGTPVSTAAIEESSLSPLIAPTWVEIWLSVFSDPATIVCGDVERVARLLQLKRDLLAARVSMHPIRWTKVFAPLLKLVDVGVLPQVSEEIVKHAMTLVPHLTNLPPIE